MLAKKVFVTVASYFSSLISRFFSFKTDLFEFKPLSLKYKVLLFLRYFCYMTDCLRLVSGSIQPWYCKAD